MEVSSINLMGQVAVHHNDRKLKPLVIFYQLSFLHKQLGNLLFHKFQLGRNPLLRDFLLQHQRCLIHLVYMLSLHLLKEFLVNQLARR